MIENLKTTHRGGGYTKVFDMPMANDAVVLNTEGYTHFSVMPESSVEAGDIVIEASNDGKNWEEYSPATLTWEWAFARVSTPTGALTDISVSIKK